jgi:hypothetical protein
MQNEKISPNSSEGVILLVSEFMKGTFVAGLKEDKSYIYIYLTAIGLLPGGSVYKRTYIQQGNHTYNSRYHTAQHN